MEPTAIIVIATLAIILIVQVIQTVISYRSAVRAEESGRSVIKDLSHLPTIGAILQSNLVALERSVGSLATQVSASIAQLTTLVEISKLQAERLATASDEREKSLRAITAIRDAMTHSLSSLASIQKALADGSTAAAQASGEAHKQNSSLLAELGVVVAAIDAAKAASEVSLGSIKAALEASTAVSTSQATSIVTAVDGLRGELQALTKF
jgi:hypothetical protein